MRKTKGLTQAYAVQDIAYAAVLAWKRDRTSESGELILGEYGAQQIAQLVRAFTDAQDRVRIHKGKPLPGSLKHESAPKRKKGAGQLAQIVALDPVTQPEPIAPSEAQSA